MTYIEAFNILCDFETLLKCACTDNTPVVLTPEQCKEILESLNSVDY